jgi:hypothetical protein
MCTENRKHTRYRAKSNLPVSVQAEGSGLTSKGIALNISLGGTYVIAPSIPFQTALVRFDPPNAKSLLIRCFRVDPHMQGTKGMALEFSNSLNNEELELLMDAGVESDMLFQS